MTNRISRPRWIAVAVIALALLAVIAWWRWPGAPHARTTQASRTAIDAAIRSPATHASAMPVGKDSLSTTGLDDAEDDAAAQACDRDYKADLRDYRAQLGPAHTADESIDRLLLGSLAMDPTALMSDAMGNEYQSAGRRWPNDVELAWLAYSVCYAGCDHGAKTQRLVAVDPGNAAAWMAAMAAARRDRDEHAFTHALQRAADAKFYDSRMGVVFVHARALMAQVPIPDSCHAPQALAALRKDIGRAPTDDDRIEAMATALDYAISIPSFSGVSACFSKAITLPYAQRKPCVTLLSKIAHGDALVEQTIATAGLLRMDPDPTRLVQLREHYRQLRWLQTVNLSSPLPEHYLAHVVPGRSRHDAGSRHGTRPVAAAARLVAGRPGCPRIDHRRAAALTRAAFEKRNGASRRRLQSESEMPQLLTSGATPTEPPTACE